MGQLYKWNIVRLFRDRKRVGISETYLSVFHSILFHWEPGFSPSLKICQRYKKIHEVLFIFYYLGQQRGHCCSCSLGRAFPLEQLNRALIPAIEVKSISRSSNSAQVGPHWGTPYCATVIWAKRTWEMLMWLFCSIWLLDAKPDNLIYSLSSE